MTERLSAERLDELELVTRNPDPPDEVVGGDDWGPDVEALSYAELRALIATARRVRTALECAADFASLNTEKMNDFQAGTRQGVLAMGDLLSPETPETRR